MGVSAISDYIVFDMRYLYEMAYTLWYNYGNILSVGFYLFAVVLGVFTVFRIIHSIAR